MASSESSSENPAMASWRRRNKETKSAAAPRPYHGLKKYMTKIDKRLKASDTYRFEDRRVGSPVLICLIAGKKQELWHLVLPYIEESAAGNYVCIVSPGHYDQALSLLCEAWGWSYLSTATSDANLAQNICYRLHDDAELIVKIDEDMFLLPNSIQALLQRYRDLCEEGVVRPGVVAPMIPLDGLSYRYLLEMLGLLTTFEMKFGSANIHADSSAIALNPKAALWVWEQTAPLSKTGRLLRTMRERLIYAPIQCSTGMIVFERAFWQEMGYLPVFRRRLMMGKETSNSDSAWICSRAMALSRPVVVTSHVLAGRFSFEHHYEEMKCVFEERPTLFTV